MGFWWEKKVGLATGGCKKPGFCEKPGFCWVVGLGWQRIYFFLQVLSFQKN
jgi:hypothetical protein